jgi:hypothetical protein
VGGGVTVMDICTRTETECGKLVVYFTGVSDGFMVMFSCTGT